MNELERLIDQLADFATNYQITQIPTYYYDALFNYLGVSLYSSNQEAVQIVANTFKDDGGKYLPLGQQTPQTLANCVLIDCLSSAILAYDDIHLETTIHTCGPIASSLLAIARKQKVSLKQFLIALMVALEVECRLAIALFSKQSNADPSYYPTGIVGGIASSVAISRLLNFSKAKMIEAMALAATMASGNRGSHGSMAGSIIPAISAKNGFEASCLIANGFTCSYNALTGKKGLITQITKTPNIHDALKDLGNKFIFKECSCKPYPFGFIAFACIDAIKEISISNKIQAIEIEVNENITTLGSNKYPKNIYEAYVSLPYLVSKAIINPKNINIPLKMPFIIDQKIYDLIALTTIKTNSKLTNDEAKITIITNTNKQVYQCTNPLGSINNPVNHDQVIKKIKTLLNIDLSQEINTFYHEEITDLYHWIKQLENKYNKELHK